MSVWPLSRAKFTARVEGAETAATIGIPAASAFCTISKRGAAADDENMTIQWQQIVEEGAADCFVDRVMTPNVFAQNNQIAVEIEDRSRVNATGPGEIALGVAQAFGQFEKCCDFDLDPGCGVNRRELLPDKFDARFPHKPQLVEMVPKRCAVAGLNFTFGESVTLRMLPSDAGSWQGAISLRSVRARTMPSERRKPAASSSSLPGVRMVTAIGSWAIRISNGSSIVTSSVTHS